ncbi:MAG: hypothetical protein J7L82_04490 [Staphylothermus sp.]|nr:hypothetical protein [Staphylothermus sp.]
MNNTSNENRNKCNRTIHIGPNYFNNSNYENRLREKKINSIANFIKGYADKIAPGLYELIELMCEIKSGKNCIELFFEKPDMLREILMTRYGDIHSAGFVVKNILLRPVLSWLGLEELENELYDLFMDNPLEFKLKIGKLLQNQ